MDEDVIINKVLHDLKLFELIKEDDSGFIREHLEFLYGAAWDNGRKTLGHGSRAIELCDKNEKIVNTFYSIEEAALKTQMTPDGVSKAIVRKSINKKGYHWRYKDGKGVRAKRKAIFQTNSIG